jgi:hypothetical protein
MNRYRVGELCPNCERAVCDTHLRSSVKTDESVSAVMSSGHAAERFEELLELRDRATALGLTAQADAYTDRIVDEMTAGAAQ